MNLLSIVAPPFFARAVRVDRPGQAVVIKSLSKPGAGSKKSCVFRAQRVSLLIPTLLLAGNSVCRQVDFCPVAGVFFSMVSTVSLAETSRNAKIMPRGREGRRRAGAGLRIDKSILKLYTANERCCRRTVGLLSFSYLK